MATLKQARAKIGWANTHIVALEEKIASLQESDVATVEINPEFGNEVIKHDVKDEQVTREMALIAGDAVHNLRCALDYAWCEVLSKFAPSLIGRFTKFPVYRTRDELNAALISKKMDQALPKLCDVMMNRIKPWRAGDFAIWPIHRLDIRDKHRLLIPIVLYSSISGIETQNETGRLNRNGFTMGTSQRPPWYIATRPGEHVINKGIVAIQVMFEYGPEGYEDRTMDSFKVYSHFILQTVEMLEALL